MKLINITTHIKLYFYSFLLILFLLPHISLAQQDSLDYSIKSWTVDESLNSHPQEMDTVLSDFQLYQPFYKYNHFMGVSYIGNVATAVQSLNFNQRPRLPFLFLNPYAPYLFSEKNTQYYNTKQAYSRIQYVTNFSKTNNLQNVDLIFTQNALPYLNVGFRYRMQGANGEYMNQKSKSSALQFFGSYDHLRYKGYLSVNLNYIKGNLNGGLQADSLLNPKHTSVSDTKLIPTNLKASNHNINHYEIAYQQQYLLNKEALPDSLGKTHFSKYILGHQLNINRSKRIYNLNESTNFYSNFYQGESPFSKQQFQDSTALFNINQTFYLNHLPIQAKIFSQVRLFYQVNYQKHHSFENELSTFNQSIGGMISNDSSSLFKWKASASYTFAGYQQNQFTIKGLIYKDLGSKKNHRISLAVSSKNTRPDYFYNHFSSHFFKWDNDFKFIQAQNLRLSYQHQKYHLEVGLNYALHSNYLYFSSVNDSIWTSDTTRIYGTKEAYPVQHQSGLQVVSAFVKHKLKWGAFHMNNMLLFQKTQNDSPIHLPDISWYHSSFFEMRFFKKVLVLQVGFDMRYHSSYYADAFMPATGLFYEQSQVKTGNYPYFNLFVNARIKRVRLFFKMEHINHSLMGYKYFSTPHYPHNPKVFRMGISWVFYN